MCLLGRTFAICLLYAGIGLMAGCAKKGPPPAPPMGTLHGKVAVKNQPVTGGTLIFLSRDGKKSTISINADGTYKGQLPLGEMQVGVDTETLKTNLAMMPPDIAPKFSEDMIAKMKDKAKFDPAKAGNPYKDMKYVPIPEKYRDAKGSGLSVTVKEGEQQKDFSLD